MLESELGRFFQSSFQIADHSDFARESDFADGDCGGGEGDVAGGGD